jgi:hypothetical protein
MSSSADSDSGQPTALGLNPSVPSPQQTRSQPSELTRSGSVSATFVPQDAPALAPMTNSSGEALRPTGIDPRKPPE